MPCLISYETRFVTLWACAIGLSIYVGVAEAETPREFLADTPARVKEQGGLRAVDRDAYLKLLDYVARVDVATLRDEAELTERSRAQSEEERQPEFRYSQFADFLADPDWWKGRPVRLVGHANRIVTYDPGANDVGLTQVYECWLVTDSSHPFPSVVVTRDVPANTPIGESDVVPVDVTGYFFQVFTYKARDGARRFAPMIVAKSFVTPEPPTASSTAWTLAALAITLGISLSVTVVRYLGRRPPRRAVAPDFDAAALPDIEPLDE